MNEQTTEIEDMPQEYAFDYSKARSNRFAENMELNDELKPEYDLKKMRVRKVGEGRVRTIVLDTDVSEVFQDSESVNEALRFLIRVTKQHQTELQK